MLYNTKKSDSENLKELKSQMMETIESFDTKDKALVLLSRGVDGTSHFQAMGSPSCVQALLLESSIKIYIKVGFGKERAIASFTDCVNSCYDITGK